MPQLVDTLYQLREEDDVYTLISRAQDGDSYAREQLIRSYTPFVMRIASGLSKRYLITGRDDEASIALIALNEAVTNFSSERGRSFFTFAETVIRRRLIDYFRRQGVRAPEIPVSSFSNEDDDGEHVPNPVSLAEARMACEAIAMRDDASNRCEEIERYSLALETYRIRFSDLIHESPKHADARRRAIEAAKLVAGVPNLRSHLVTRRELPLKELEKLVSVSRKTLERQRRYIIALAVIIIEDFRYLREYVR